MRIGLVNSTYGRVLVTGLFLGAALAACSATGGGSGFGNSGGNGAGNGNGSGAGNQGSGGLDFVTSSGTGASMGVGGGCVGTSKTAEQVPLDMYIMMDQSGSMSDTVASGATKWDAVKDAITGFVGQPEAAGIGVGIGYFPYTSGLVCPVVPFCATNADCGPAACGPCMPPLPGFPGICQGASGDSCVASDYAKPDVEIAPLPGVGTAIISSMGTHGPTGGTPTSAALQGTVDHAKAWAISHPDHTVIAVLATDGVPSGCNEDINFINGIAAAGLAGTPSIKTFVIGVGQDLTLLQSVAAAGGTNMAFLIDTNQNASDQFLKAMNEIRGAALSCAYLIPPPPQGEMIDFSAINVQYTPDGGMPQPLPQVKTPGDCPPAPELAWYYDNPNSPKQIMLCPGACDTISADTKGKMDVVLGCATIVK